ncbi:MAG TPA: isocitrate lyase/PEP mutase family protein [Solirubrobacterales bacterium]|nr:isocitrate lyase/PEP mutase family protein [Solirubrobacterales bacterium]
MRPSTQTLRDLLDRDEIVLVPGVGNPLEARLVEQAGFEAVYMSGYATAATVHGHPDIGMVAAAEMVANAEAIRLATRLPVITDCDTGYGDVPNVRDIVRRMASVGADGVQLEDQVWPKKCGHMEGKEVEDAEVMERKIRAAVLAREGEVGPLIFARTDSRATHGLAEAIERSRRYAAAGADVIFIDAPESREELRQITAAGVEAPIMVNISETGKTPILPLPELQELGFAIVIYPTSALRVAARAIRGFLTDLRAEGDSRSWLDRMMPLDELNAAVGIEAERELENEVLSAAGSAN